MDEVLETYMRFVNGKYGVEEVRRVAGGSDGVGIRKLLVEMEEEAPQVDMEEVKRGYEFLHTWVPKDTGNSIC